MDSEIMKDVKSPVGSIKEIKYLVESNAVKSTRMVYGVRPAKVLFSLFMIGVLIFLVFIYKNDIFDTFMRVKNYITALI